MTRCKMVRCVNTTKLFDKVWLVLGLVTRKCVCLVAHLSPPSTDAVVVPLEKWKHIVHRRCSWEQASAAIECGARGGGQRFWNFVPPPPSRRVNTAPPRRVFAAAHSVRSLKDMVCIRHRRGKRTQARMCTRSVGDGGPSKGLVTGGPCSFFLDLLCSLAWHHDYGPHVQ